MLDHPSVPADPNLPHPRGTERIQPPRDEADQLRVTLEHQQRAPGIVVLVEVPRHEPDRPSVSADSVPSQQQRFTTPARAELSSRPDNDGHQLTTTSCVCTRLL